MPSDPYNPEDRRAQPDRQTRTTMLRDQPWILIIIGIGLVAAAIANEGGVLLGLIGFLVAAAGVALWVIKVARS